MNKLVVGCGYLGRRVADLWLAEGHRVWATTRSSSRAEELRITGLHPIVCDVLKPNTLTNLPKADSVLYCVGYDRAAGIPKQQVYVDGLRNVLENLPQPGKFIYISSTGVYGQTVGEWVDETAATEPVDESGHIMLEAERLLRQFSPAAVTLRFAGIYGPDRLLMRRQALEEGKPIGGNPDRWLNLIHVDDGAAAVLAAEAQAKPGSIYNICDGNPVTRREFYSHLARLCDAPAPRFTLASSDSPVSPRERGNRRISNRKMLRELKVELCYPSYLDGLGKQSK